MRKFKFTKTRVIITAIIIYTLLKFFVAYTPNKEDDKIPDEILTFYTDFLALSQVDISHAQSADQAAA